MSGPLPPEDEDDVENTLTLPRGRQTLPEHEKVAHKVIIDANKAAVDDLLKIARNLEAARVRYDELLYGTRDRAGD